MATAKKTEETKVDVVEDVRPEATRPEATQPEATQPEVPAEEEKVEVFIPKGYANDEPNLFVGVNGKSFLLPKGKKSVVPKYIADEIERSRKAEEKMDQHIAEMTEAASK